MRSLSKGFSLIETIVALGLIVLLAGLALRGHGSEKSRAGADGLAQRLAAECKAARQQAMAQGAPVALCFPSDGKRVPVAQSFYRLEGQAKGKVTSVTDLSSDYPLGLVAVGFWDPGAGLARPGGEPRGMDPDSWLPDSFSDYALIFNPSGAVTTNGLPLSDSAYRLLACSAVEYTSVGPPGGPPSVSKAPGYFQFKRVAAPHQIVLTPQGQITVSDGVEQLPVEASPFAWQDDPAPAIAYPAKIASLPKVESVEVFPPPPVDEPFATVTLGGSLKLKVSASNPEGDDMSLRWTGRLVSGSGSYGGGFSQAGQFPMTWDTDKQQWQGEVAWIPPHDAQLGDTFLLSCQAFTSGGTTSVIQPAELREVTVTEDEEIVLGDIKQGLYRARPNGSGLKQIVSGTVYLRHPSISPDGSRIVWTDFIEKRTHLRMANFDGSGAKTLFVGSSSNTNSFVSPVWNLASTRVYFADGNRIRIAQLDGSPYQVVTRDGDGNGNLYGLAVSSDQNYMAFIASGLRPDGVFSRDLYVGHLDRTVDPPKLVDVSNVTADTATDWVGINWRSGLSFRPNPAVPTEQTVCTMGETAAHGAGGTLYSVRITDTGVPGSSRFTGLKQPMNWGSPYAKGLAFSRDGSKMALTRITGGLEVWDWQEAPKPILVNRKVVDIQGLSFGYMSWR
jgi:type II secretory pathway pseudopilin PulG